MVACSTCVSGTNLTEHWQLCKTNEEIDNLQQSLNLIRVESVPTHGALQPSWPETLITLAISVYAIIPTEPLTQFGFRLWIFKAFIPFAMITIWLTSFIIAEINSATAGWISVNMAAWLMTLGTSREYYETDEGGLYGLRHSVNTRRQTLIIVFGGIGSVMAFLSMILGYLQICLAAAIVGQRQDAMSGFGTVGYNITNMHGCQPWNSNGSVVYLEQGARSHTFKIIQMVQLNYSCLVFVISFLMMGKDEPGNTSYKQKAVYALCTILLSFPLFIYEAIIATKGTPVVISGNCMLVELDPRLGFLDSEIDNWWKALVGITGL
jgi:hypothetical protein